MALQPLPLLMGRWGSLWGPRPLSPGGGKGRGEVVPVSPQRWRAAAPLLQAGGRVGSAGPGRVGERRRQVVRRSLGVAGCRLGPSAAGSGGTALVGGKVRGHGGAAPGGPRVASEFGEAKLSTSQAGRSRPCVGGRGDFSLAVGLKWNVVIRFYSLAPQRSCAFLSLPEFC